MRKDRAHLYNTRSYRKKLHGQKAALCRQHGIAVHPNGALKDRRGGLPPFLRKLSERIHGAHAQEDRYRRQVAKPLAKRVKVGAALDCSKATYAKAWHHYATCRQVWRQFRQLSHATDLCLYRRQRRKLLRRLDKVPNKMTRKIAEFLDMPRLRRIFQLSPGERAGLGPINTKRVEGFFSQVRVTLDALRNAPDMLYIRAR